MTVLDPPYLRGDSRLATPDALYELEDMVTSWQNPAAILPDVLARDVHRYGCQGTSHPGAFDELKRSAR